MSTQRALREQSESNQSIKIRVIQSEHKILRLVFLEHSFMVKSWGVVVAHVILV